MHISAVYRRLRVLKFRLLSNATSLQGTPILTQPVLFTGRGRITVGSQVRFGNRSAPFFYTGYIYIGARIEGSVIAIKDDCEVGNNSTLVSEGAGIHIGKGTIIGPGTCIYDSDFHGHLPSERTSGTPPTARVDIGDNVFIGSNVIVLKGSTIGRNSIIGAGSIVTGAIPEDCIAAGNPCKVIRSVYAIHGKRPESA